MKWILLGALASALIVACGSQRAQMPSSVAPQAMPGESAQHEEITRLSQEIAAQRGTLGLGEHPVHPMDGGTTLTCVRSTASACTQSCTLADSICDNAKKICHLASELPGDGWAEQKCADASATCDQAKASCCACA
ncbi:hypothetical protein BH11MYX1_BH11MYX1_26090 [soil metagenome]